MIFLKKFEAKGFKSFADMTKLNFDSAMIGIVGPNGSGKSNVIDAIKWVLGEKSIKSLRGKKICRGYFNFWQYIKSIAYRSWWSCCYKKII